MHFDEGELRTYLDRQIDRVSLEAMKAHLAGCERCQALANDIQRQASTVEGHLALLAPGEQEAPIPARLARAKMDQISVYHEKENKGMLKQLFGRRYRVAWIGLAAVALLVIALAFPPVQAIANSFLGLFRVQKISVIQVNPSDLPEQLGSSTQLEYLLSQDVTVEEQGKLETVASAAEASSRAGFPLRLPAGMEGEETLQVQPGGRLTFEIDLPRVRTLLQEIGRADIQLPDELDGATVLVEIPNAVTAMYGECQADLEAARQEGYDPDEASPPRLFRCTTLVQMHSPTISAPPGLDLVKLGEAYLQMMGMTQAEAARFAQSVDWTTTLVVPIPRYATRYQEVFVDGVTGTFIQQDLEDHTPQYLLVWVKEDILYALTGPGNISTALEIASSLK